MAESTQQTFWDHLDALRGVLVRIAIVVGVLAVGAFAAMPWIFDNVVLAPCRPDFPLYRALGVLGSAFLPQELSADDFALKPVSLELTSQFFVHVSSACWTAAVIGFPIVIYLLWSFISPGLYDHEKRGMRRAFLMGNLMFYLGVATGYFVVFPLALRFLATYTLSSGITAMVSLDSYMDNFYLLILAMGLVFELPLLAWLLGKAGILSRSFFKKYRRHAIVVFLVLAALITPTGDPFTLLVVFIPLYALWECSSMLVPRPDKL